MRSLRNVILAVGYLLSSSLPAAASSEVKELFDDCTLPVINQALRFGGGASGYPQFDLPLDDGLEKETSFDYYDDNDEAAKDRNNDMIRKQVIYVSSIYNYKENPGRFVFGTVRRKVKPGQRSLTQIIYQKQEEDDDDAGCREVLASNTYYGPKLKSDAEWEETWPNKNKRPPSEEITRPAGAKDFFDVCVREALNRAVAHAANKAAAQGKGEEYPFRRFELINGYRRSAEGQANEEILINLLVGVGAVTSPQSYRFEMKREAGTCAIRVMQNRGDWQSAD